MGKKSSVIVNTRDIETKVKQENNEPECFIYKTQNVYLSSFLISQDNFKLGRVYIEDLSKDNRANIEIAYEQKFKTLLDNYLDIYNRGKAIVNLDCYQRNIRFLMHLINKRKSGLVD